MSKTLAAQQIRLNAVDLLQGTVDPSTGAGVAAPIGSIYLRSGTAEIWLKIDAADTQWSRIAPNPNVDPTIGSTYFDDFVSDRISFLQAIGGGANGGTGSEMGSNGPGTLAQIVTAAGVDGARIVAARNSGTAATFFFGGGPVIWRNRHQITTLSNGFDRIVARFGMHDAAGLNDATDGVYLEYDLATHGDQNYRLCAANNGVRTKVDTGIAAVAGSNRSVIIVVNAAGTSATVMIDGVAGAAPVAANIPVTQARNTFVAQLQAVKSLGAAALQIVHDYYHFSQIFTTPR